VVGFLRCGGVGYRHAQVSAEDVACDSAETNPGLDVGVGVCRAQHCTAQHSTACQCIWDVFRFHRCSEVSHSHYQVSAKDAAGDSTGPSPGPGVGVGVCRSEHSTAWHSM
jgi:hypothetical protein